jgi:hypothetical protein
MVSYLPLKCKIAQIPVDRPSAKLLGQLGFEDSGSKKDSRVEKIQIGH